MKNCPMCNNPMGYVGGIGDVCPTSDCPVTDDADLWITGKRVSLHTSKAQQAKNPHKSSDLIEDA